MKRNAMLNVEILNRPRTGLIWKALIYNDSLFGGLKAIRPIKSWRRRTLPTTFCHLS